MQEKKAIFSCAPIKTKIEIARDKKCATQIPKQTSMNQIRFIECIYHNSEKLSNVT